MLGTLAAACVVVAVVMVVVGQAAFAIPVVILLAILVAAGTVDALAARRKVVRHAGDIDSIEADEDDALPTMVADDEAPMGATRQSHTDIDVHDLPVDHPSRPAVPERARQRPGTRSAGEDRQ